ncbi:MAG: hypothetical protein ACRECO_04435 [Xanthobacteraceae bacterium]
MRSVATFAVVLLIGAVMPVHADHAPVIVIPGKAGVPVVINGYDASYTIVEGDWGLSRPGHMTPTIVSGPLIAPAPYYPGSYFPALGRRPGYGRHEIEPPPDRRRPPPAQSFHREWNIESAPTPATLDPPAYPPPVIEVSPEINGDGQGKRGERHGRRDRRNGNHRRDHRR